MGHKKMRREGRASESSSYDIYDGEDYFSRRQERRRRVSLLTEWQRDQRRAKKVARKIGLAYWPALAYGPKVDPRAYVIAEAVLARKVGARWMAPEVDSEGQVVMDRIVNPDWSITETPRLSHGGWDSKGCHGPSADMVASMWLAAGCRDGAKFRLQVFHGVVAKKRDTVNFLRNFARGLVWLESNGLYNRLGCIGRKPVAALGRLSPELRRAAIDRLLRGDGNIRAIRVRDLDWVAVKATQDKLRGAPTRVRAALATPKRRRNLLGLDPSGFDYEEVALLTPEFPRVDLEVSKRIVLGESPVQISDGLLTRREAHQWMTDGAPDIGRWLSRKLELPEHRSVRVIRWLHNCRLTGRWAALERDRTAHVPGEGERTFTALAVLDEIQDEDIVTGKDSVDDVIERSARRLGEAWLSEHAQDHRILCNVPDWAKILPRGMRLLRTTADLVREGKEMEHCVGGYANAVSNGQCYILAIETRQGRSTVELTPRRFVAQHRGLRNSSPPQRNEALLTAWLNRVEKTFK